jgi:hypothetical protein
MTAFACGTCGATVTADLVEVPFPEDAETHEDNAAPEPRVRRGTFALAPDPFGPPYEPSPHSPQIHVPAGPRATVLVHPDDVQNLSRHPDPSRLNGCCHLDGLDGPNLVCTGCGAEIATEQSDCWVSWHDLRLQPQAVVSQDA